ncbi:hypothetical protein [Pelotalea chapellei]|uniref:Uncharacterized protein n=1 Tax=Pelotalea chapellei TaxID=44671 RepID=A0ABS5UAM9_9BACT|nr:hypothetical protein [Pelotalea chapellei]MBT1072714.1 hypothetical protein [Pelotalea chapellei]
MEINTADQRITAIASQNLLPNSLFPKQPQPQLYSSKTDGVTGNDKVTIQLEISRNTLDTLQKFGSVDDLLVSTARNVRQTNETLSEGAKLIDEMKVKLETIVKQYPPFLQGSTERIDLLAGYSGLQKEITSLMIPPPPPPIYEKVQHLWDNLFSGQSHSIQLPQLPNNVPDSHVKVVVEQLDSLKSQVSLVQEAMGNSIKGI